ncbi:MAG: LysR family transcriptional regulator [Pseudomonadota bacterium]
MNIAAFQTFLAVVETGNLSKAAEQLNVTQSTVTTRLDVLEETLGQKLLVRSRRGAELTKAGFAFQRHAELMVQAWDQARKTVGLPRGFSGLFSFGCHYDLWEGAGALWLDQIRRNHPDLALETWAGDLDELTRWLGSGLVDAALSAEPIMGADLIARELMKDRLVQVSTERRPVQEWHPDYVYVDLGPEFRRQHTLAWPGDETAHMTFSSSRWALDYLLEQGGSAYLPQRLSEPHVRAARLFPVVGSPEFTRPLFLVWRKESAAIYPWVAEQDILNQ